MCRTYGSPCRPVSRLCRLVLPEPGRREAPTLAEPGPSHKVSIASSTLPLMHLMQDSAKDLIDSYRGLPAYPLLLLPRKPLLVRVRAEPRLIQAMPDTDKRLERL